MLEFSLEELKKAAKDFHKITNITIVLYDAERKVIYAYPENINGFCRVVRENPELYKRCIECDNYGFSQCEKTGRPYIYTCHMNLFEAVAPITENNVIIGYMMMGQILEDDTYQNVKKCAEETAIKYGLDYENMCKA